jgi:hypothetical protein
MAPYNDHSLSVIAEGSRQGQISRFEVMLQAALGDRFLERHPWRKHEWYRERVRKIFYKLKAHDVPMGTYEFPPSE